MIETIVELISFPIANASNFLERLPIIEVFYLQQPCFHWIKDQSVSCESVHQIK
jgi:hypothetical protein